MRDFAADEKARKEAERVAEQGQIEGLRGRFMQIRRAVYEGIANCGMGELADMIQVWEKDLPADVSKWKELVSAYNALFKLVKRVLSVRVRETAALRG